MAPLNYRTSVGFSFEESKDLIFYAQVSGKHQADFIRTAVRLLVKDLKTLGFEHMPYSRGIELLDAYFEERNENNSSV